MSELLAFIKITIALIPTVLLFLFAKKTNLKKCYRSKQFPMPFVALIYVVLVIILLRVIIEACQGLANLLAGGLSSLGNKMSSGDAGFLASIGETVAGWGKALKDDIAGKLMFVITAILNFLLVLGFIIIKRIIISICKGAMKPDSSLYRRVSEWLYVPDDTDTWYIQDSTIQAKRFVKILYIAATVISVVMLYLSLYLYSASLLQIPFVPVLGVLVIGEIYFYLDGMTAEEKRTIVSGEKDFAKNIYNYISLRKTFRRLFGDKLADENTTIHNDIVHPTSVEELLETYRESDDADLEIYTKYLDRYRRADHKLDQNYVAAGKDLLKEKSILFSNPFYYDFIPYVFYPMQHQLLNHRKVLVLLGRHGIEDDIKEWCLEGLKSIANIRGLWRVGVLPEEEEELDVGILTRSDIQNLELHRNCTKFFNRVSYVVIIEPSKIITTAQIGLNSIIRYCRHNPNHNITFCSFDKNCDGLVDALSHAVMSSITEVSATESHDGVCSYMCWEPDSEHLQHRMLPDIARYVGVGTELSFLALKNQVSKTAWYGGDRFPVVDMHWVAKQYYNDLLQYAELPVSQTMFDDVFKASANLWNVQKSENAFLTVEDESNNLFEMKRTFSTRATNQSFINVISSPYLLYDYMTANGDIFNSDAKAIPYIVGDYVSTPRNILLRLVMQMVAGPIWEHDIRHELALANIPTDDIIETLWSGLCEVYNSVIDDSADELTVVRDGVEYVFTRDVLDRGKQTKYNIDLGKREACYQIEDQSFINTVLCELLNVRYIAEEENEKAYIGTEIRGQIFQKYLPGQFFTLKGKYYEMLKTTFDNRILVRRAADHITGRQSYRQIRRYTFDNIIESETMGSQKQYNNMRVFYQQADISVQTQGYWKLDGYNNFATGLKIDMNKVPERHYNNKQIVRIDFPELQEEFSDSIRFTLTNLMNEIFRSIFAENQDIIVALTAGEIKEPLTYSIQSDSENFVDKAIYIVEDSQYDVGLLEAVVRNLNRIYQTIYDYLLWNREEIERSTSEPEKTIPDYRVTDDETIQKELEKAEDDKPEKKGIFQKIKDFFKKLFKKKDKKVDDSEAEGTSAAEGEGEGAELPETEADGVASETETTESENAEGEAADDESETAEPENAEGEVADDESETTEPENAEGESGEVVDDIVPETETEGNNDNAMTEDNLETGNSEIESNGEKGEDNNE